MFQNYVKYCNSTKLWDIAMPIFRFVLQQQFKYGISILVAVPFNAVPLKAGLI